MRRLLPVIAAALALSGCLAQERGAPEMWFASHGGVAPQQEGRRVVVCHGFGCHLKTAVAFGPRDVAAMRKLLGRPATAAEERRGIARVVAFAEARVAGEVGSEHDVAGMDFRNAGRAGQMDCIDEATNTTSYLMLAQEAGLLRFHRVGRPASRGIFLDGRYPHATATVLADGTAWAVDSWPTANGTAPVMMPLDAWYGQRSATL